MKKRLIIIIIFSFIILFCGGVKASIKGDVDGNNKVAIHDYVLVRKHLLKILLVLIMMLMLVL